MNKTNRHLTKSLLDTQVWDCDPLVISDAAGSVIFAGKTQLEFTPDDATEQTGWARVSEIKAGIQPDMRIVGRRNYGSFTGLPSAYGGGIDGAFRPGRVLRALDSTGQEFVWHINGAADAFLTGSPFETS